MDMPVPTARDDWQDIRDEALALLSRIDTVPSLRSISPDHRRIAPSDLWKSFFLYDYGYPVDDNCERCPRTAELVAGIPGLNSAFFSILLPGMHIKSHRGPTKGLVTCHLGLMVPDGDTCRMRLDDQILGWREGECLMFDDTYRHEVRHDGDTPRIVLLVQVERPLRARQAGGGLVPRRHPPFAFRPGRAAQHGRVGPRDAGRRTRGLKPG